MEKVEPKNTKRLLDLCLKMKQLAVSTTSTFVGKWSIKYHFLVCNKLNNVPNDLRKELTPKVITRPTGEQLQKKYSSYSGGTVEQ